MESPGSVAWPVPVAWTSHFSLRSIYKLILKSVWVHQCYSLVSYVCMCFILSLLPLPLLPYSLQKKINHSLGMNCDPPDQRISCLANLGSQQREIFWGLHHQLDLKERIFSYSSMSKGLDLARWHGKDAQIECLGDDAYINAAWPFRETPLLPSTNITLELPVA